MKHLNLSGCKFITKLPNLCTPNLEILSLSNCENLVEIHETVNFFISLKRGILIIAKNFKIFRTTSCCKNLRDLPDGIYKLQQLQVLDIPTAKLRPTCNSFDSSSGYGFLKMTYLKVWANTSIIELDLLMKPDYFPALERIDLTGTNIITIPESISRFPRLRSLSIHNCKHLREIQGLPLSISMVAAENCPLLDYESPSGLLNQVSLFL